MLGFVALAVGKEMDQVEPPGSTRWKRWKRSSRVRAHQKPKS